MERDYIDLLELLAMVREELEAAFPERFWVKAEIASVQTKANGHCYLELVQHENGGVVAKVKANIWRSRFAPLRAYFREATGGDLAVGMEVLLRVQVTFSEAYGFSLNVEEIYSAAARWRSWRRTACWTARSNWNLRCCRTAWP